MPIALVAMALTGFLLARKFKRLRTLPQRTIAVIAFLIFWEVAVRTGLSAPMPIPAFSSVLERLITIAGMERFWAHTAASVARVVLGYALALLVGVPLGFLLGWFDTFERYLDPFLQTMRQIPPFALYPAFILFMGIGELPKVLLIMLAAFWWILLNTTAAVKNADASLVKLARSVGASGWDLVWMVLLPTASRTIVTGMRYASTEVVLALMTVEMLGASRGLGLLLSTPHYWAILLFMTILGVIANYGLLQLEQQLGKGQA